MNARDVFIEPRKGYVLHRLLRTGALKVQAFLNGFDPAAKQNAGIFTDPSLYPIFVVGAPRSGSTLLYQLLIRHMGLAYISNFMSLVPIRMIQIAKYGRRFHGTKNIQESRWGYLSGIFAPSEAGGVQRKWFEGKPDGEARKMIRGTVVSLSDIFSAATVVKNLANSLRLENILTLFPEGQFIFIRRNLIFNAQSILISRRQLLGSEQQWWSTKPRGYREVMKLSPARQVIWQVNEIERSITSFLAAKNPHFLEITYEQLCDNPDMILKTIAEKFNQKLFATDLKGKILLRNKIRLLPAEFETLKKSAADTVE